MKTKIFIITALLILFRSIQTPAFSVHDPNDPIYQLISGWEDKGYIKHIPLVRPYPPQLIRFYLEEVISKGSAADQKLALAARERLERARSLLNYGDSPIRATMNITTCSDLLINQRAGESFFRPSLDFNIRGDLHPLLSYAGNFGVFLINKEEADFTPYKQEKENFFQSGEVSFGEGFNVEYLGDGGIFFGSETLYFQAGLMRTSFGPFFDNSAVIGPQVPEAGHFSFTYNGKWVTFSTLFLELIAKSAVLPNGRLYSLKAEDPEDPTEGFPSKHLVVHSAALHPFRWLSFGLIQSVLYGGRFDPLYLIPFQTIAETQNYMGDWDNALMGFYSKICPLKNLNLNFILYVDDFDLKNITSNQSKLAFQTGLFWTPHLPLLLRLSLDYLMVTPYMYTHSSHQPINYLTYTHLGKHLGSVLDPNSDQITFKAFMMITDWIQGELWARYSRHGNHSVAADVPDEFEGTIWDDGYKEDKTVTFRTESSFLKQSVLEKIFQIGINTDVQVPIKMFDILFKGEYVFEYINNKGLVENASQTNHYIKLSLGFRL